MITVFGIDVGSYRPEGHFAWYELSGANLSAAPTPNSGCKDPVLLATQVVLALERDDEVAIGVEAPLWVPRSEVLRGGPPALKERFPAEKGCRWYVSSGASVGMVALTVLGDVLAALQAAGQNRTVTDDLAQWRGTPRAVAVYEAFLPSKNRPASCGGVSVKGDEWDAFVSAALLFERLGQATHLRNCTHPGKLQRHDEDPDARPHSPLWVLAVPAGLTTHPSTRPPATVGWSF